MRAFVQRWKLTTYLFMALPMLAATGAFGFQLTAHPDNEPFPITVVAQPSTLLVGTPVELSGNTLALLNDDVLVTITAAETTPPQATKLPAPRDADGNFKVSFRPRVAGTYTVDAMASDGKGHASARFTVEDPHRLSQPTAQGLVSVVQDAQEIAQVVRHQLDNVPASPARDEVEGKLDDLVVSIGMMVPLTTQVSDGTGQLIQQTGDLPLNIATGDGQPEIAKFATDRQAVVEVLGQTNDLHQRSQAEIAKLKMEQLTCDNLEKAAEGIKFLSAMFNVLNAPFGIIKSFALDFASAAVTDYVKSHTGSATGGFLAGEVLKNQSALLYKLSGMNGKCTDLYGFLVDQVMGAYCEQFTGPVTGHMHAMFTNLEGTWWEYSFDVRGQITLHYPKGASGGSVPLKGRIEGFAANYKVRENALTMLFPDLMSSAVQKRIDILPLAPVETQVGLFKKISSVEGSILGLGVTPSSFMFEINGTATPTELDIQIGPQNIDTNDKTKVIALYLSVLSMQIGYAVFSLPYKPVHFVFERAAPSYTIPLHTGAKVIRGKQHFETTKDNGNASGRYSIDIEACNPDC